jgi:hypothetical protein
MTMLTRIGVKPIVYPRETAECPELGGDVIVRGMSLSERLALSALNADLRTPKEGEPEVSAQARAGAQMVPLTLAQTVELEDGSPVYTPKEWDQLGADHPGLVLRLFRIARRLSGQDNETLAKN